MVSAVWKLGAANAAATLGVDGEPSAGPGVSATQAGLVAGAGAAPFMGMIGQRKIIHDPMTGAAPDKAVKSLADLQRLSMPGDVLITSKPAGSLYKGPITALGGSELYHAQPVVGRTRGAGLTASAGDYAGPAYENMGRRALLKEPGGSVTDALAQEHYNSAVLLRPKNMGAQTRNAIAQRALDRAKHEYDTPASLKMMLHELFVPKVDALVDKKVPEVHTNNVCSTMPAMAAEEVTGGRARVVPGKAGKHVWPQDFLRSKNYEVVGHRVHPTLKPSSLGQLKPLLTRAGVGAAMAGTTLAGVLAYNRWRKHQEQLDKR